MNNPCMVWTQQLHSDITVTFFSLEVESLKAAHASLEEKAS